MTKEENMKFREELIKKQFKNSLGYDLNLDNPQTFNEKIQWLKLYFHDSLMTKCADKYLAREHIKEKVGEEYLIPLLGVWDKAEDINFDSLSKCNSSILTLSKTLCDLAILNFLLTILNQAWSLL